MAIHHQAHCSLWLVDVHRAAAPGFPTPEGFREHEPIVARRVGPGTRLLAQLQYKRFIALGGAPQWHGSRFYEVNRRGQDVLQTGSASEENGGQQREPLAASGACECCWAGKSGILNCGRQDSPADCQQGDAFGTLGGRRQEEKQWTNRNFSNASR